MGSGHISGVAYFLKYFTGLLQVLRCGYNVWLSLVALVGKQQRLPPSVVLTVAIRLTDVVSVVTSMNKTHNSAVSDLIYYMM